MSEDYADETLKTIVSWGRYAELFAYDEQSEVGQPGKSALSGRAAGAWPFVPNARGLARQRHGAAFCYKLTRQPTSNSYADFLAR